MINKANYALHDYASGELLDVGVFTYDDYFFHLMEHHTGVGMICDVLANSYLDEYLSCMLIEHISTITDWGQRIIYIHDASDGTYTLAQLKPYMVLVLTYIVKIVGEDDDE